jgi:hypothetical protein
VCVAGLHFLPTNGLSAASRPRPLLPAVFCLPPHAAHDARAIPHHPPPLSPRNPSSIASNVSASHWLARIRASQQSLAAHSPGYPRKTDTCTVGVDLVPHTTLCKRPSQPARRPAPSRPPSLSLSPSVSNARSTLRRPVCRAAPDPAPAAATASNLTGSALLSCVFKPFTRGPPADPDRTSSLGPPLPCPHRYRRAVLQPPVALYGVAREGLVCLCLRQGVPSRDPTHRHDCFPAAHPVHPLTPRAARHGRGFSLALFCPAAHPETKVPRRLRPPGARCAHRAGRAARATPTPSTTRTLAQHTPAAAAQPATPRRRRGGSHPEPRCCHNHHRRR